MTDLSPAAAAVLDAFSDASDGEYVEGVWVVNERTMLAAALRAAADQLLAATWEGAIQPNTTHSLGINWSCDALHAIAAELEGTDG